MFDLSSSEEEKQEEKNTSKKYANIFWMVDFLS